VLAPLLQAEYREGYANGQHDGKEEMIERLRQQYPDKEV